jgi:hypothetical protein
MILELQLLNHHINKALLHCDYCDKYLPTPPSYYWDLIIYSQSVFGIILTPYLIGFWTSSILSI